MVCFEELNDKTIDKVFPKVMSMLLHYDLENVDKREILETLEPILNSLDNMDALGTEGWRHYVGL